jgi:hypothetical protein
MSNERRRFLKAASSGIAARALVSMLNVSLAQGASVERPELIFLVTRFGAKGDGKTLDTVAINAAIEAAARAGGGTVLFAAGSYLCYSIHLKSNVTLQLASFALTNVRDFSVFNSKPVADVELAEVDGKRL